jgi:uncharacterized protein YndB with AHSA1/START domain
VPVTSIDKNADAQTMTVTAEFDASAERVWQIWADPRQLERWWGPPTYPATVLDHDLRPGGLVKYFMTGPEGDEHRGWWRVIAVEERRRLEVEDGFGDSPDNAAPGMPIMAMRMTLADRPGGGTQMTMQTRFPSAEAMQRLLEMGMEEGLAAAMSQIEPLLAA